MTCIRLWFLNFPKWQAYVNNVSIPYRLPIVGSSRFTNVPVIGTWSKEYLKFMVFAPLIPPFYEFLKKSRGESNVVWILKMDGKNRDLKGVLNDPPPATNRGSQEPATNRVNAREWLLGVKNSKNHFRVIWRHWPLMTRRFHDIISSHLSVKCMYDSKTAPQITFESGRTRKKSAKVIDLVCPQLTSVDLRRIGLPVECMSTTWYYMFTFILAKTAMLASYVPRNAFPNNMTPVMTSYVKCYGVRVLNFSGGT